MRSVISVPLSTLLLDPLFNEPAVVPVMVSALDSIEAYAEKVRAALTRRDPAPRDLYDLHHAVESGVLDWDNEEFLRLAARKIATEAPSDWLDAARIDAFRRGLESELRPVLRSDTYEAFDFTNALATMTSLATAMKPYL